MTVLSKCKKRMSKLSLDVMAKDTRVEMALLEKQPAPKPGESKRKVETANGAENCVNYVRETAEQMEKDIDGVNTIDEIEKLMRAASEAFVDSNFTEERWTNERISRLGLLVERRGKTFRSWKRMQRKFF